MLFHPTSLPQVLSFSDPLVQFPADLGDLKSTSLAILNFRPLDLPMWVTVFVEISGDVLPSLVLCDCVSDVLCGLDLGFLDWHLPEPLTHGRNNNNLWGACSVPGTVLSTYVIKSLNSPEGRDGLH